MKSISVKSRKHLKRNLAIAIVLVVVACGGAFAYYKVTTPTNKDTPSTDQPDTNINQKPATDEQKQAGENQKQTILDKDKNQTATPSSVNVTITAANQNGTILNIRSLINTVTTTASCHLALTKGSVTVTKTSGTQALADSSTCKGFDIPTSELSKGTWHAILTVTVGSASGKAEQDIVIN